MNKCARTSLWQSCGILTSTCIQILYFLQMSATAKRGSKAPYTVVPAVALTRKGTNPYTNKKAPDKVKQGVTVFVFFKSGKKQRLFSLCHTYISSFGTITRSVNPLEPGRIFTLQDLSSPGHSVGPASCLMRTDTLVLRRGHTGPRGEEALWCPQTI